jgi:uncharacterized Ntn-hydrolase superfamily protein
MTFSILGRCTRTNQIGAASASYFMAVGARVAFAEADTGAVLTQSRTDPRLGPMGLAMLRGGNSARATVDALVAANRQAAWRQIAALDPKGGTAAYSGARARGEVSEAATQNAVAIGNTLSTARVPSAMLISFQATAALPLSERLLQALEAGLAAGGDARASRSARLLVVERESFPLVDLRVDWHEQPIAELRALWVRFAPLAAEMMTRAIDPEHASAL